MRHRVFPLARRAWRGVAATVLGLFVSAGPATAAPPPAEDAEFLRLIRWFLSEKNPVQRESYLTDIEKRGGRDPRRVLKALRTGSWRKFQKDTRLPRRRELPSLTLDRVEPLDLDDSAGRAAQLEPPKEYDSSGRRLYPLHVGLGPGFTTTPPDVFQLRINLKGLPIASIAGVESLVTSLIAFVQSRYPIDPDRVLIHGQKDASEIAWYIALHNPDRWAGVLTALQGWAGSQRLTPNGAYFDTFTINSKRGDRPLTDLVTALQRQGPEGRHQFFQRAADDSGITRRLLEWEKKVRRRPAERGQDITLSLDRPEALRYHWLRVIPRQRNLKTGKIVGLAGTALRQLAVARAILQVGEYNTIRIKCRHVVAVEIFVDPSVFDVSRPLRVEINGGVPESQFIAPNVEDLLEDFARHRDPKRLAVFRHVFPVRGR